MEKDSLRSAGGQGYGVLLLHTARGLPFASVLANNSFLLFGKLSPAILDLSICVEILSLSLIYYEYR